MRLLDVNFRGLPKGLLVIKNPLANAGDIRVVASITGSGISPGGGHGNPLSIPAWRIPWTEELASHGP